MDYFNPDDFRKSLPKLGTVSSYDSHAGKTVKNINIPFAFDTETTATYHDREKIAFMYEWTFGYFYDHEYRICYGRTWEEFLNLVNILRTRYRLGERKRIIIYVHNLAYEFQFMHKYFTWDYVFATDKRYPVKGLTEGIEFKDSLILANMRLAKVGDNLQKYKVEKKIGDLDYNLIRTSSTPMTEKELGYCENDVKVVLAYIQEQIEQYDYNITKIPMTNTGRVRRFIRDKCFFKGRNHKEVSGEKFKKYSDLMQELTLTPLEYKRVHDTFGGGFTHANYWYVGKRLEKVSSIDFTSSYPAVMLTEKFPMSKPIEIHPEGYEEMQTILNKATKENKGYIFFVVLKNIICKTMENYISSSKCFKEFTENVTENNGRVNNADRIGLYVTDIDFRIINQTYDFEVEQIGNVYEFHLEYLPKPIIEGILELYEKKTTLKGVEGKEVEYLVSKGMLNSVYGMSVTALVRAENIYDNKAEEWKSVSINDEMIKEQIEKYNKNKKRFLYYPWGVWVTAYARRNLWKGIIAMDADYVYSDTDSIKFLNLDQHKDFIESYNKIIEKKLKLMCDYYKIDFSRCKPKTIKGKEKLIGVWDFEGTYDYFKTLGAKRYLVYKDGKYALTVAGLDKKHGMDYIKRQGKTLKGIFDFFNKDMLVPETDTGKNTLTYLDEEQEALITDYLGNSEHVKSLSSIHMDSTTFKMNMSDVFMDFLEDMHNGYFSYWGKVIG